MAANDELPRGLNLQAFTINSAAVVTFPAAAGISWVVDAVNLTADTTTASVNFETDIFINGKSYGRGIITTDNNLQLSWSGKLPFPPNTAVTVESTAGASDSAVALTASAYPI